MLGDITNILSYEIKSLTIKESQIAELQAELQQSREDHERRLLDQEALRQKELNELQVNFERKYQRFKEFQIDIEKINSELQEQNEHIRSQFALKEAEIERLAGMNQQIETQLTEVIEDRGKLEGACCEILGKYESLVF